MTNSTQLNEIIEERYQFCIWLHRIKKETDKRNKAKIERGEKNLVYMSIFAMQSHIKKLFGGFLGSSYDPLFVLRDPNSDDFGVPELTLRTGVSAQRLSVRRRLFEDLNRRARLGNDDRAATTMNSFQARALDLLTSSGTRSAFQLDAESDATRDAYGRNIYGQSTLLARRLIEAGTRVVEVVWPKVANSDNHSWDHHVGPSKRMKDQSAPMLDSGLAALISDLDEKGLLDETLVVAVGEFGRSPQKGVSTSGTNNSADGRDHWPYCYTGVVAGAGIKRGYVHGKSDKTASAPIEKPVHPRELLATIYHSFGIDPETLVYNHLNQPRELVKAQAVTELFA